MIYTSYQLLCLILNTYPYMLDTYMLFLFEYFSRKVFEAYKTKTEDRVNFKKSECFELM